MADRPEQRRPEESNDWLTAGDDFFTETLESITAELPGQEEESTAEETEREEAPHNETPEEILARFRKKSQQKSQDTPKKGFLLKKRRKKGQDAEDADEEENEETGNAELSGSHPRLRRFLMTVVSVILVMLLVSVVLFRLNVVESPGISRGLEVVSESISDGVTPVQTFFSSITDSAVAFLRRIKYWYNLETAYEALREENEQLVYQAMLANELQTQLSQFENMNDEVQANRNLNPLICTVIGKNGDSYFSTFTINHGRDDGVEEYMAVTLSGALIGYTETVTDKQATVRTIIDSEASIAALIQSSRDQGTVRGTLGIDGTAMCRMYYLPDDHLPRPGDVVVTSGVSMSFPKGIPIGTVRESTRGMDANKQYIVVEPTADFQHIEYVIVLRYKPAAGAIQSTSSTAIELVPLETARPYPTIRIGSLNYFATDVPEDYIEATETPSPTPSPSPTPAPTSTPIPITLEAGEEEVFEYAVVTPEDPNVTPTSTPTPTPTPYITLGPDDMTLEDD
ncbi:MAG: rod shape-determining protein MreC [Clostridia bacterium]|nr:rod shape-determining protein MreC [Clostridia bacterium]